MAQLTTATEPLGGQDPAAPLRVLMVVEATLAGVGRHVLDLAEGLCAAGHVVDVAYGERRCEPWFRTRLDQIGLRHHFPIGRGRRAPIGDIVALRQIAKHVAGHRYDIVHGHASRGGAYARAVRPRSATIVYTPNAYVTQAPQPQRARQIVFRLAERLLARRTDLTIHVAESEAVHATALGYRPKHTSLVPNGIPLVELPDRSTARRELGLDPEATIVGFVGRLTKQKAPERLIAAFPEVLAELPGARLALVGDGPLDASLRQQAAALGIAESIDWLGYRNGQEAMPAFDTFVLPSRYEGFPYVALEALWAGVPIITSDAAGCGVLLADPRNGRIADVSPAPLAASIVDLLRNDPGTAAQRSAAASTYSVEAMVSATLRAYHEVLTTTRRPA